jgi:hypothetical protein
MEKITLGKLAKDKITGFEGIIIGRTEYLFGCDVYGLAGQAYDPKEAKRAPTEWFDDGRLEIIGAGITVEEVKSPTGKGSEYHELPNK